jgi:hypothetical protein
MNGAFWKNETDGAPGNPPAAPPAIAGIEPEPVIPPPAKLVPLSSPPPPAPPWFGPAPPAE